MSELTESKNQLAVEKDRNARGRFGWKLAEEAVEASQRYIAILEQRLAKADQLISDAKSELGNHTRSDMGTSRYGVASLIEELDEFTR